MGRSNKMLAEMSVKYSKKVILGTKPVISSIVAYEYFLPYFKECLAHHEEVYAMFLNNANIPIGISKIAQGGLSSTIIDIRVVLQYALLSNATGIVIAHNHPSGKKNPSTADNNITQKLKKAASLLDISLLDHIIVCEDGFFSYAESREVQL